MEGARKYANVFKTGQYGRLYIESDFHARGKTFHIYILPENEQWPNSNAVEVYGIVSGQPGWTETYGWLHRGKWCDDFMALYKAKKKEKEEIEKAQKINAQKVTQEKNKRVQQLLEEY